MKKILIFSLIVALLGLTSCPKIMYKPAMQNVPLMEEKGDFKSNLSNNNYQLAYATSDNIAVMLNGHYNRKQWASSFADTTTTNEYDTKRWSVDGGAGYYRPFSDLVFEAYGGAGYGSYDFDYDKYEYDTYIQTKEYNVQSWRGFIQPSLGFCSDYADIAFSTRLMYVGFFNPTSSNYSQDELIDEELADLEHYTYTFIEPALTMRFGIPKAKLHMQLIYSYKLNQQSLNYMPLNLNFGITLNISEFYKQESDNSLPE
ncbi:MAG: hypothetical protein R6V32_05085 [Bacteroidales bacterium]